jgi:hypothetical protein
MISVGKPVSTGARNVASGVGVLKPGMLHAERISDRIVPIIAHLWINLFTGTSRGQRPHIHPYFSNDFSNFDT